MKEEEELLNLVLHGKETRKEERMKEETLLNLVLNEKETRKGESMKEEELFDLVLNGKEMPGTERRLEKRKSLNLMLHGWERGRKGRK